MYTLSHKNKKKKSSEENSTVLQEPVMKDLKPNGKGHVSVTIQPMGGMIICK